MFMVYRDPKSVASLARAWEQADEVQQNSILAAARRIDEELQDNPQEKGEARGESTRILFLAPLAVTYEVDEEKKVVRVLRAWAFTVKASKRDRVE